MKIRKLIVGIAVAATLVGSVSVSAKTVSAATLKAQTITASNMSVNVGSTKAIGAHVNDNAKLTYETSNKAIATVDKHGKVKGVKAGSATITIKAAKTTKYKAASKKIKVTVNKLPQTIKATKPDSNPQPLNFTGSVVFSGVKTELAAKSSNTGAVKITSVSGSTVSYKCVGNGHATISVYAKATDKYAQSNTFSFVIGSIHELSIDAYAPKMPVVVRNAFKQLNCKIYADASVAYTGLFNPNTRTITVRHISEDLYHEIGHFIAICARQCDRTAAFNKIFNTEVKKFPGFAQIYAMASPSEYFAECVREYIMRPNALRTACPQSYQAVVNAINSINDANIKYANTIMH